MTGRALRWRLLLLDAVAWGASFAALAVVDDTSRLAWAQAGTVATMALSAALVAVLYGRARGLYTRRWPVASIDEAPVLAEVTCVTIVVLTVLELLVWPSFSLVMVVAAGLSAMLIVGAGRLALRRAAERSMRPDPDGCSKTVVVGAGEAGTRVIASMLRSPSSPFLPVALIDDDPLKRQLTIMGVPVRGGRADLARVLNEVDAQTVVVAIPSATADGELLRDVTRRVRQTGVRVLALPPVDELFTGSVQVEDIRPLTLKDLLGRREVAVDLNSIAGYVTGRRVLVTGAGGSIGSELCRQLHRLAPSSLVMLDRDESALHAVQLSMLGHALLDSRDLVVADIRDPQRLKCVFDEHRPDVVFHAAALKHLPLLEMHPCEAVKSNVLGTRNMLEVSQQYGVQRFVNISTDKAADPTSVLGYSKRLAERLTAYYAHERDLAAVSVRFGNVLGSRGSVLTTFYAQIAGGGPVTVTHPRVTRYFMMVEEAVSLVVQAGAVGRPGEVLVLDMGAPVNIDGVARRLIQDAGAEVEVVYTGLRPGEKLDEVLLGEGEVDERPVHPLISHVEAPALWPADLERLGIDLPRDELVDRMSRLCVWSSPFAPAEGHQQPARASAP